MSTQKSERVGTDETAALVRQMRDAQQLAKNSLVAFKFMPGPCNAWEEHDEANLQAVNTAIAVADQWLAQQRGPLTDEQIDALDIGGYPKGTFNTRSEYDRAVRRMLARAIERAHGIS